MPHDIQYIPLQLDGKPSNVQYRVPILQTVSEDLRFTYSGHSILMKDQTIAAHIPNGTIVYVPLVATEIIDGKENAILVGIPMTAETLHRTAEIIRSDILDNEGNLAHLTPLNLNEAIQRTGYFHTSPRIGFQDIDRPTSPITPQQLWRKARGLDKPLTASTFEHVKPTSVSRPPTVVDATLRSPKHAIPPPTVAPAEPRPVQAIKAVKETKPDNRPAIYSTLESPYTEQAGFTHHMSSTEAEQVLRELIAFMNTTYKGSDPLPDIQELNLAMKGSEVNLHLEMVAIEKGKRQQRGINLTIRNSGSKSAARTVNQSTESTLAWIED